MGQEPVLLTVLVVICLSSAGSAAPSDDPVIEQLLNELRVAANSSDPVPRILLALRLTTNVSSEVWPLCQRLEEQTAQDGINLSSGMAGLYVLAMIACCVDPSHVPDPSPGPPVNLLAILSDKVDAEMKTVELHGHPLTTYYQVALGLLGLCEGRASVSKGHLRIFTDVVMKGELHSVDTEAMSALALRCLQDRGAKPQEDVRDALIKLIMGLYCALTDQGTIGNIYSTGLGMQAFIGNKDFIPPSVWNSTGVRREMLAQAEQGAFRIPISAAQVLPPLLWKSYLDVSAIPCSASEPESWSLPATGDPILIRVYYTVHCSQDCWHSIRLAVRKGATILDAMRVAERERPQFKFKQIPTAWGPYITSIGGTEASSQDRTYWEFLIGTQPIPVGVAEYKLSDGDHIFAKFTTY
ncbi:cobalamin binding intrinsic factor-like isoform X1 [Pristis pectinata]|uniref:cobalamin binding intrinsic factor-like isoform X1 n=1 Tax=Pristis pectinata TaxID=685728 RepID=UPI00223E3460|nr:cobalamin binding intrinsic factor-like isoform X1 [Pristis pectinata]